MADRFAAVMTTTEIRQLEICGSYVIHSIGVIHSDLKRRDEAPRQGCEGAPDVWLEINGAFAKGLQGIEAGREVIVVTWFHEAGRDTLSVHPRRNQSSPLTGVFSTRSPDRPNPMGLHSVTVREIVGSRLRVGPMEPIDGTLVVDIKPVLPDLPNS